MFNKDAEYVFVRFKNETDYPQLLSDSWPDRGIMWDEDMCSFDVFKGDAIYKELVDSINQSLRDGYKIEYTETLNGVTTDKVLTTEIEL